MTGHLFQNYWDATKSRTKIEHNTHADNYVDITK